MAEKGGGQEILDRLEQVTKGKLPEAKPRTPKTKQEEVPPPVESPFTKAATEKKLPPKVLGG